MKSWRVTGTALLITTGLLASTGCAVRDAPAGTPGDSIEQAAVEVAAAMGADGQALAAMGFDPADIDTSSEAPEEPGERAGKLRERHRARVLLRRNTLHGEVVVQTENGTRTVLVQRGTVTAVDTGSITVASTDGYTLTWRFGDNMRVAERRATIQPEQVAVGTEVGVAGARDGDDAVARLVVVPIEK